MASFISKLGVLREGRYQKMRHSCRPQIFFPHNVSNQEQSKTDGSWNQTEGCIRVGTSLRNQKICSLVISLLSNLDGWEKNQRLGRVTTAALECKVAVNQICLLITAIKNLPIHWNIYLPSICRNSEHIIFFHCLMRLWLVVLPQ